MIRNGSIFLLLWLLSSVSAAELTDERLEAQWSATMSDLSQIAMSGPYPFNNCFDSASAEHGVPLPLLLAVARGESMFDPAAVSEADAYGVMQIRWPVTANHLGITKRSNLYDPCINIRAGAQYLSELLQLYDGNVHRALAAYNFGPSRIPRIGGAIPQGGRRYSDYIHSQLVHVIDSPGQSDSKTLVSTSSIRYRAVGWLEYLKAEAPSARFQFGKERGRYVVWLLHSSSIEYRHGVSQLRRIGIRLTEAS